MKRLFLIVSIMVVAGACDSGSGPSGQTPEPDMFVRRASFDMTIRADMIQKLVDAEVVIRQCEPGETRECGSEVGACKKGVNRCSDDGLWNIVCEDGVEPTDELCDGLDNDCDDLTDEVFRLGGRCKTDDDKEGSVYCDEETKMPACVPDRDCTPNMDGDPANICSDCDDNDENNYPGNDERCDGSDNDCDDKVDEGFILGQDCSVGDGVCARSGVTICAGNGMNVTCNAEPQADRAIDELCDGEDNDCDGKVDEDFDVGDPCVVGLGVCENVNGIKACNDDGMDTICTGDALPDNPPEVCNGLDDDCDGFIDEKQAFEGEFVNPGDVCGTAPGVCSRDGTIVCSPEGDGTVVCTGPIGPPDPLGEICNNLDDDCDGRVDEGNPQGGGECDVNQTDPTVRGVCRAGLETCVEGTIVCRSIRRPTVEQCNRDDDDCDGVVDEVEGLNGECFSPGLGLCRQPGINRCEFGSNNLADPTFRIGALVCTAVDSEPEPDEVCNGLDDDCDGRTDERIDLRDIGQNCPTGQLGRCGPGTTECVMGEILCRRNNPPRDVELCNDEDDDCNGIVDTDTPGYGDPCSVGFGVCTRDGTKICNVAERRLVCSATPGPAAPEEICDGLDNNCNDAIDEGFALGIQCTVGVGECERVGQTICGVDVPEDDGDGVTCSAQPGPIQNERCNNLDDDCDGKVDEEIGKGDPCTVGRGICERNGFNVCERNGAGDFTGAAVCNAQPGDPFDREPADGVPDELCNGLDDDCDGDTDEGNPQGGGNCVTGNPGICGQGTWICTQPDGGGMPRLECIPDFRPNQIEEQCNGLDDNCNGIADEGNPEAGQPCQTGLVGVCANGTTECVERNDPDLGQVTQVECIQNVQPAPEICDGLNNDCDQQCDADGENCVELVDEDFPGVGERCDSPADADLCALGILECDQTSQSGTVCVRDEPRFEICNNRDDDCDGVPDNGIDLYADPLNCGACNNVCPDPNPECIDGACFRTFWVDETLGSNATGDGSRDNPWRTINYALTENRVMPEDLNDGIPPARVNILPGRYAPDQWTNLTQCDSDGDGSLDDKCALHTVACETNGNENNSERCPSCVCDPALTCAGGLCSLPEAEQEVLPVIMKDTVQLVGFGNRHHIVIDGGTRACFTGDEADENTCNQTRNVVNVNLRGKLIQVSDMMDERARSDTSFHVGQPNWYGIGSRNLLQNLTLLRGGYKGNPGVRVDAGQDFLEDGKITTIRIKEVEIAKFFAANAHSVMEVADADVLLEKVVIKESDARGSKYLVLITRANLTIESSHFEGNDVFEGGPWKPAGSRPGQQFGGAMIKVSNARLDVRNSTFTNNLGGGIWFHDQGKGTVTYSTFAGNTSYGVSCASGSSRPMVIANNIFTKTGIVASVFLHRLAQPHAHFYNNLFSENTGKRIMEGGNNYDNVVALNLGSFATDNFSGGAGMVSIPANNVRLKETSFAVDAGRDLPLPLPITTTACANNNDCILGNIESYWDLDAHVCDNVSGMCIVDPVRDADNDGAPDWIEIVYGSDPLNFDNKPATYAPRFDFDGAQRPSGDSRDVGAFEYPQLD